MAFVVEMILPAGDKTQAAGSVTATTGEPVNPAHHPNWDVLVKAHPDYSFFHGTAWARTLESTYGFRPVYLTASAAGTVRAVLPLMEVDSWLTGRRGIALPFTDNCGPLYRSAAAGQDLIRCALDLAKSRGWKSAEFRGGRELFPEALASLSFYGHSLNLENDEDLIFARLDSSVRRAINKAKKKGVVVTASQDLNAIKIFFSLQCQTRKRHGLPPQPFTFFKNVYEHILSQNLGMVVIACYQKHPIAGAVFFQLGNRAIYKFGASDKSFQEFRGANLVMWEGIRRLAQAGAKTLHLGRTSMNNEGLRRFKLGWGAREQKIEYVKYDLRRNAFITGSDTVTGWHNRVFQTLPLSISRMTGAALYRHLA